MHCSKWRSTTRWPRAKSCSVPTSNPPQHTMKSTYIRLTTQSMEGAGYTGNQLIYWVVHEKKCMWTAAHPLVPIIPLWHCHSQLPYYLTSGRNQNFTQCVQFTYNLKHLFGGWRKRTLISEKVIILYSFKHDMQPWEWIFEQAFCPWYPQLPSIIVNRNLIAMFHNHILVNK